MDYEFKNKRPPNSEGKYLLYWMQGAQRVKDNKALAAAALLSQSFKIPCLTGFIFTPDYPEANRRHFSFMYDGIQEVKTMLKEKDIGFSISVGNPVPVLKQLANEAALVICDSGYLKPTRRWRENLADTLDISLLEISTNLIVPVKAASSKEEYAAYTIRKKLKEKHKKHLKIWKIPSGMTSGNHLSSFPKSFSDKKKFLNQMVCTPAVTPSLDSWKGGYKKACKKLNIFLEENLLKYEDQRSNPDENCESNLSPYLHFGHISPREIALKAKNHAEQNDMKIENFWEELTVRRELSFNFTYFNQNYDKYPDMLPEWARETLAIHQGDDREYIYSTQEFENAKTHDKCWNAAQLELVHSGKIHNYMRMYWGKKILEWTENPVKSYNISLYLNNKYALDGRDPNSYSGIAWCFGKHDRAWQERKIFGKVRYMNRNGLERKFSLDTYLNRIKNIADIKSLHGK